MKRIKGFAIASCLALLVVAFLPSSKADEWNKKTILTVNEPLAVPGKVLQPGKYVMKLMDSPADRHVVQIFNEDETQLQTTVIAIPNYRLTPTDKTQFAFWEMPAGQPRALKAWFYPGDNFGQEFAYPKELATTIAQTNNESVPTVANNAVTQTTPSGESQPMAQEATPSTNQPSSTGQSTIAQSTTPNTESNMNTQNQPTTPPPANESATSNATNQPNQQAATQANAGSNLPRTASPFPLVGLAGLLSLGGALGVRVVSKRTA